MELFELVVAAPTEGLRSAWVDILGRALTSLVGGFSAYEGQGTWVNSSGVLVKEPHIRLMAYCIGVSAVEVFNFMAHTIQQYKDNCQQEVVLAILNGKLYLLEEIPETLSME